MPDPGAVSPDIATMPKPEAAKVTPPPPEKPEATTATPTTRSPEQVRATLQALANGKSIEEAYKISEPSTDSPSKAAAEPSEAHKESNTSVESNATETGSASQNPSEKPTSDTKTETTTPSPQTNAETKTQTTETKAETTTQPVDLPAGRQESMPNKETVDAILSEANGILLELRDMRLLVNAVATQAADTPLGNEVRMDALRSLENMSTIGLPPDQATALNALQEKIKAMNLPTPKPEDSATLALLTKYNEQYPNQAVPQSVMEKVRTGDKTAAESVAQMLQTNNDLSAMTWKELTGQEGFTKLNLTPGVVLDLAGLPRTKENEKKAAELFGVSQQMKEPPMDLKDALRTGFMYGALGIMFFNQVALGEGGGGH